MESQYTNKMMRRNVVIIISLVLVLYTYVSTIDQIVIGQKNENKSTTSNTEIKQQSSINIVIPQGASNPNSLDEYYIPSNTSVQNESAVTWENQDLAQHTATARDGSFNTELISAGQSATVTITGSGKLDYYCLLHPWMTGILHVQP